MKNKRTFASILWIIAIAIVSLTACASMTITEVEWDTLQGPQKVRQFLGISNSEVKVFAHFKNGDRRQISAGSLRYDRNTVGPQTVIVSVNGVAGGSFQTEVMKLIDIRIERLPTKTAYTEGEQAALSGIKVMGKWEGMPDAEIPVSQLRVADFNSSAEGSTNITVSYNGMNASFPVTVTARAVAPASAPASGTGTNSGNSGTPASASAPGTTASSDNDEWQRMIDRINLLVDNHFENRDYNEEHKANWNLTGLSVGVYKNGRTAFFNRGFHESEQRRVANRSPVTENSIFLIGSLSKPVSNILLSYFSRINNPRTGRPYVNLNDSINNYFPTKPYIDTDGTRIYPTLLQFAEHYAGVPRYVGEGPDSTFGTLARFKSTLQNLTYTSKPGTAYNYSMGAAVVANVIASVYYNDFPQRKTGDLLKEQLFNPLGMNSTMLHGWVNPAIRDRLALPHNFNGTAKSLNLSENKSVTLIGASGEITSTTSDMMRLAAFILGDQVPAGTEVLQQAAAAGIGWRTGSRSVPATALTPHESNIEKLGGRFRELFTRPSNSGQRYGKTLTHGGAISGYQTHMIVCPDTKTAVVIFFNTIYHVRGTLAEQIIDRVLNATYSSRRTPFDDFDDRVASYSGANANVDIALNADLTIGGAMNNIKAPARAGATLTIRSANPAKPVTLTRGVTGDLFTVPNGATLIFRDIIIDGGGNISPVNDEDNMDEYDEDGNLLSKPPATVAGALVRVNTGGTFIMESGAVLRNNVNSGNGGAVAAAGNSAVFTMNGGSITGNTAATSGGGLSLWSSARFNMTGGEISGNTAARGGGALGVSGSGTVMSMSGGRISGNNAATSGGGMSLWDGAQFTMTGGEFSNNTASGDGGGIMLTGTGSIINLNGGEISGNTAAANGGGVRMSGGAFTMRDGKINGNTANQGGGGASVSSSTVFTINGGTISGNAATTDGGGIALWGSAVITMTGGEISGNTAGTDGGGVKMSGGAFTMRDGKINGNTANRVGGGAGVSGSTVFNINGGSINGNTAVTSYGGGIGVWGGSAVITMSGGEIIGNTAGTNGNCVRISVGTFNLNSGVVAGTGANIAAVVSGTHNLNTASPNNAVIIAWNRPSGTLNYTVGSNTNLTVSAGTTVTWQNQNGSLGISYRNGSNTGWIKAW